LKQYDRLKKQGGATFSAADVYGAEHLMRLLACLPELLAAAQPESEKVCFCLPCCSNIGVIVPKKGVERDVKVVVETYVCIDKFCDTRSWEISHRNPPSHDFFLR